MTNKPKAYKTIVGSAYCCSMSMAVKSPAKALDKCLPRSMTSKFRFISFVLSHTKDIDQNNVEIAKKQIAIEWVY
jgi:hypothetical protein